MADVSMFEGFVDIKLFCKQNDLDLNATLRLLRKENTRISKVFGATLISETDLKTITSVAIKQTADKRALQQQEKKLRLGVRKRANELVNELLGVDTDELANLEIIEALVTKKDNDATFKTILSDCFKDPKDPSKRLNKGVPKKIYDSENPKKSSKSDSTKKDDK